jgi:peptide chain release factor subunit 1
MNEAQEGEICFDLVPPIALKRNFYRCDHYFHVDLLRQMLQDHPKYGVILISGDEARIYSIDQDNFKHLMTYNPIIHGKHGRGGQSKNRFERLHEEAVAGYHKKVIEKVNSYFIVNNEVGIKGLIFAGPSLTKAKVAENEFLDYRLKKMVLKTETIAEITDTSIVDLIARNHAILSAEDSEIQTQVNRFEQALQLNTGLAVYGQQETLVSLNHKLIRTLIVSSVLVSPEEIKKLKLLCEEGGCELIVSQSQLVQTYGGYTGLLWYADPNEKDPYAPTLTCDIDELSHVN